MEYPFTIQLTFDEILNLSLSEAEEKSFYIRYLLIREKNEEVIDRYYQYLTLLAGRIDFLRRAEGTQLRKSA